MALQVRRGTNAERLTIIPEEGELIYTTDTKVLYVGDGVTTGGTVPTPGTIGSLLEDTSPQLGGNLDLNGQSITGTGTININGTITATGNINLGDGEGGDIIQFGGQVNGNLVPDTDNLYNLGSSSKSWSEAFVGHLNADSIDVNTLNIGNGITADVTGNIVGPDSTIILDGTTGSLVGSLTGDVQGSVFAQDSTTVIDGIDGTVRTRTIETVPGTSRITLTRPDNGDILDLRIESKQTRSRININTVDLEGDLSSYTGFYGTLNFGYEDSTTDRSDATIRGSNADMRLAHDTVTSLISDETKYFTLKEGKFGFGTYTPEVKMDVRGPIRPGVYADTTARDADISSPVAGMMIFVTDGDGAGNPQFQGYDGSSWVALN